MDAGNQDGLSSLLEAKSKEEANSTKFVVSKEKKMEMKTWTPERKIEELKNMAEKK